MDINKTSFDISQKKDTEINIIPFGLSSSFDIQINKKSVFSLVIYGFNLLEKYLLKLKTKIDITANASMKLRAVSIIKNKMEIIISEIKENLRAETLISSSISLAIIYRDNGRNLLSLSKILDLVFNIKETSSVATSGTSRVDMTFNNLIRTYRPLSYWSSYTLAQMDTLTLNEIEYGSSPNYQMTDDDGSILIDDLNFILRG